MPWAGPIIDRINKNSGLNRENLDNLLQLKDYLFELRFAHALYRAGVIPKHEVPGEAKSMIDFGFESKGQQWAVEMMRLGETEAVKEATVSRPVEDGIQLTSRYLSTDAITDETFKAIRRICQKCERNGRPHKFPEPGDALQVLLVDFRTFMNGGDGNDMLHVAFSTHPLSHHSDAIGKGFRSLAFSTNIRAVRARPPCANASTFWALCGNALPSPVNSPRRPTLSQTHIFLRIPQPSGPPPRLGRCSRSSPQRALTDGTHSWAFPGGSVEIMPVLPIAGAQFLIFAPNQCGAKSGEKRT